MTDTPKEHHVHRDGGWMSSDKRHHHKFLNDTVQHVDQNPKPLHPVLQGFKATVEKSTRLTMLFNLMFQQIPAGKEYLKDPSGENQVRDFDHLLQLLNHVISTAPRWTEAAHKVGIVGVPVNALLDWPMGTSAGFCVFQDPEVNEHLKKILNVWGAFLSSPSSAYVLGTGPHDWLGPIGKPSLMSVANAPLSTSYSFSEFYHSDPSLPHHGYASWDAFFTRRFKDTVRPVASPSDDGVVANACESTFYKVARDIKARDQFWVKGQPYSVLDILAFDPLSSQYIGGTIYQAFLSALSYHRWHAPVSGTVVKAYIIQGTYFSEPLFVDFDQNAKAGGGGKGKEADVHGETTSQEYLSATATRAVIFIEAGDNRLGTVAFLGIGMTEVSTCEITVKEGDRVKKGDQTGQVVPSSMFHFGGSTHCVLFEKGVELEGFPDYTDRNVPVRSKLCHVV
ncbi:phosphatidylserine decarboxylase [Cryptococcus wingfieldii CBS 7118]|uniref:Phosphatidylserine decarboxylase n=1 Tax=Cryptococcus wingfieldii CBS 7118 TaxID=1295528 RepID=A0A1E3HH57_9TREE|nr:phosphatidylserine decarboxylase [Cryptococcus wingfieldii CBS 7118]ODN75677.1 phosphatidylserine decarboxylase [Cryptococcus wingfieldii CBS 7118]